MHCEILFSHSRVRGLKGLRGAEWDQLVERIAALPETHVDALAFSFMMIKLCNCLGCDLGSYKAALGCTSCSRRTVSSIHSDDKALMRRFKAARKEIIAYLESIGAIEDIAA